MALSQKIVQFFVNQIRDSNSQTFGGNVSQLFEHLKNNIKDNPVYDKYMAESQRWLSWPDGDDWVLPKLFEATKYLTFSLYKRVSDSDNALDTLYQFCYETSNQSVINEFNGNFLGHFAIVLEEILNANPELAPDNVEKVEGTRVFIIHGHDDLLKKDLQLLLERAGVNNIVLHEQPDKGRSIIDKIIEEGKDSNYAIALLTPDDTLANGGTRARQNVILEIGYFVGLLGKERVRMLVKGEVEIPTDLSGILYQKCDDAGAWKSSILKELMAVGIYVDMTGALKSL